MGVAIRTACALWLSVPAAHPETETGEGAVQRGEGDDAAQLREAVDPDNERVELVGRLTAGIHPSGRAHEYLLMIAAAPDNQGQGLRPPRPHPRPPGRPRMWPMWREPQV